MISRLLIHKQMIFLFVIITMFLFSGCFITSIGSHRNATPIGKSVSSLNIRGISNLLVYAGVIDYRYGYNDFSDISIQLVGGQSFRKYPVYGIGLTSFHAFKKRKQMAFDIHGSLFSYNKLIGIRLIQGSKDYISYELNWTNIFEDEYAFTNHLFVGYSNPKGLSIEFGVSTIGFNLSIAPLLGVGYNFQTK